MIDIDSQSRQAAAIKLRNGNASSVWEKNKCVLADSCDDES